jgi:hypothetical protein
MKYQLPVFPLQEFDQFKGCIGCYDLFHHGVVTNKRGRMPAPKLRLAGC